MNAMKQQVRSVQAEMDKLRSVHKLSREESDAYLSYTMSMGTAQWTCMS